MRDRYASLREGLVGAWIPSVSGSGLLLPDLSGQGNNGTLTNMGPEDWVSSQYGRALDFDGVNDYASVPLDLSKYNAIGISLWFRYFSHIDSGRVLLELTTNYNVNIGGFLLTADELDGGSSYYTCFTKTAGYLGGRIAKPAVNTWHNWVVNFRRSQAIAGGGCETFIDGVRQPFVSSASQPDSANFAKSTLYIASRAGSSLFAPLQLDDIRIYNRALTEPEIKLLSQEPGVGFKRTRSVFDFGRKPAYLPPTPTDYRTVRVKQTEHASLREGLVGAWCPSIEGSGYTLPDLSGQGNNGTLTNMGPEDYQSSHYGKTLYYDGSDAATIIGDVLDNVFVGTSAKFTVSSWINLQSNGNCMIASKLGDGATGGGNNRQWALRCLDYDLDFAWYGSLTSVSYRVILANTAIQNNVPTHVAATFDASISDPDLKAKLFINGDEQAFTISFTSGTPVSISNGAARLSIGAAAGPIGGTISYDFIGQIDDTRIYNRVLSESEIKLLASRPGIGLRPQRRTMYYAPPTGARRRRILTSMP